MTKGGLAKLLLRLEMKGLIERRAETRAGRATKTIFLTKEGRLLAGKVDMRARQLVQESESPLRADEVNKLHAHLRTVRNALLPHDRSGI